MKNSILIFILVVIKDIDECANPETNESHQSLGHSTEGCSICCCLNVYHGDGGICTAETTFLNIYKCTENAILSTYQTVLDHLPPTNCISASLQDYLLLLQWGYINAQHPQAFARMGSYQFQF